MQSMSRMGNMDENMVSIELPSDPDAQATVTDFLDFTEYLPSDMNRSLALIEKLDYKYTIASAELEGLSRMYGNLPAMDPAERPDPPQLREDISEQLNHVVSNRTLAQAEAYRMDANIDRHYQKLIYIQQKLEGLLEAFPAAQEEAANAVQSVSPQATRIPKITLRLGEPGAHKGARVKRGPRITVPGEVLAPNEFDWDTYDSESDISATADEQPATPKPSQRRASTSGTKRIKLKVPKLKLVDRTPKTPRAPRPPGVMGTNVHSQVAGISTSNALAKLKPPPDGAPVGSEHRPWGRLTQFELAKLRKRMKKNAVWQPSTTMINRELAILERSLSHYRAAKAEAEAAGLPFDRTWESQGGAAAASNGAAMDEDLEEDEELPIVNKGMKLNEQKKAKKESLAKLAAVEAEESARKLADTARVMRGLFSTARDNGASNGSSETPTAKTPSKSAAARKRKRESTTDIEAAGAEADTLKTPAAKKAKTETPVRPPQSTRSIIPQTAKRTRATIELPPAAEGSAAAPTTVTTTTSIPLRASSPRKSSTPILPPLMDKKILRGDTKKPSALSSTTDSPALAPTPDTSRARRSTTRTPIPSLDALPDLNLPVLSSSRRPPSRGKAASVEPGRTRRASTARATPAPEVPTRPPSRRAKRPAPGPVAAGEPGAAAISVGKRTAAPKRKAGKRGVKEGEAVVQEPDVEVDEDGVPVDPNEPRYCVCNGVSFGEMIACENNQCQYEWFHLPCVGLTIETLPPRTTKWYCPECRVALHIGEKGEVSARGQKK
ncbi:hypothetical protein V501_08038 [Pseudogymnoascus sp. VKM F-4519 (FW-2642)]|nr:hypothetical protein V501_08038 [Pseudogymnoascus sp. VKM F-4519 (FW-2642)]